MAKILKYDLCVPINRGTEETPEWVNILYPVAMGWSEANEELAGKEAHNGVYSIEDDGTNPVTVPTREERLCALEEAVLEMMGVTCDG